MKRCGKLLPGSEGGIANRIGSVLACPNQCTKAETRDAFDSHRTSPRLHSLFQKSQGFESESSFTLVVQFVSRQVGYERHRG